MIYMYLANEHSPEALVKTYDNEHINDAALHCALLNKKSPINDPDCTIYGYAGHWFILSTKKIGEAIIDLDRYALIQLTIMTSGL